MYVAIEGIDGSGKSTLAQALGQRFKGARLLREPSAFGEGFKRLALQPSTCETARMFLFLADRAQQFYKLRGRGGLIISDRSFVSHMAYSDELGIDELFALNECAMHGLRCDKVIYLDIEPGEALKRIHERGRRNCDEISSYARLNNARRGYLGALNWLQKFQGVQVLRLDATKPREELLELAAEFIASK